MSKYFSTRVLLSSLCLALCGGVLSGCTGGQQTQSYSVRMSGNPAHGKVLIESYGCGACHMVPGIHSARGTVGPSLAHFSNQSMIPAGMANSPDNLVLWLRDPVALEPKTAMPNLGIGDGQAHDIAAYLYTLR